MFVRKIKPGTMSRLTIVDHRETYGRHVLDRVARGLQVESCLDLGCGSGDDLRIVGRHHPGATLHGLDFGDWNAAALRESGITPLSLDLEREPLPFDDASLDLVIANQVLEHTKEVFWINHEIFRTLRVGGHFFMGVPNVLSLHNRLLMLLGRHPTQHKLVSAHVRPFSRPDIELFYRSVAPEVIEMRGFWGAQFYPFPGAVARLLSRILPSLSFSIFVLIRKTAAYQGQFLGWLDDAGLETNFYRGNGRSGAPGQ